ALLVHLHRRESRVLPAALPRPLRHAAPLCRLSGCLRRLEPGLLDRFLHLRLRRLDLPLRPDRRLRAQAAGGRQSLGRPPHHAGRAPVLAAAVPPVRNPAAGAVTKTVPRRLLRAPRRFEGIGSPCPSSTTTPSHLRRRGSPKPRSATTSRC